MADPENPKAPIDDLGDKLEAARARTGIGTSKPRLSGTGSQVGTGMRVGADLIAAILVAGVIGLTLDRFLNTTPWFMIGGIFVGFATGLINLIRLSKELNSGLEPPDKKE